MFKGESMSKTHTHHPAMALPQHILNVKEMDHALGPRNEITISPPFCQRPFHKPHVARKRFHPSLSRYRASKASLLRAAVISFIACGFLFKTAPARVTRLLKPYASLKYRNAKDGHSSGCRYFSFIHAVVVTSLNFYILLATKTFDDSPSSKDPTPLIWKVSRLSQTSLGISLGYLLLDAMLVAWYLPAMGGWDMVTHHISAVISVLVTAWYGEAHMYTLSLLSTECTTPFINLRWLLEKMQWKGTVWYKVNGIGLVISWIIVRIAMFPYFFTHLYYRRHQVRDMHWPVALPLLVVPPLLALLNLLWFSKIARGAVKLFLTRQPKIEKVELERNLQE